jgi:hypothetical protein
LVERMIRQYAPDSVMSPKNSDDLSIPEWLYGYYW